MHRPKQAPIKTYVSTNNAYWWDNKKARAIRKSCNDVRVAIVTWKEGHGLTIRCVN